MHDPTTPNVAPQPAAPTPAPRRRRRLSQREQIRMALRALLRVSWRSLWLSTRNFSRAWVPIALGAMIAIGNARTPDALALPGGGVVASVVGSQLTVTGSTGDDAITITSEGGFVKINGLNPENGAFESALLRSIVVYGDEGADTIDVAAVRAPAFDVTNGFNFEVYGQGGDDTVVASPAAPASLYGDTGFDTIRVTADGELLFWGSGNFAVNGAQSLSNGFEQATLMGGAGADTIDATSALIPVSIAGAGGDDTLRGGLVGSTIDGGAGSDTIISGFGGESAVLASAGSDSVTASGYTVLKLTADSNMALAGGPVLNGNAIELAPAGVASGETTLSWGGNTTTLVNGSFAEVWLTGGPSANVIDASGYTGNTRISGEGGDDTIRGGSGGDKLNSGPGADTIYASDAGDSLADATGDTLRSTADRNMIIYSGHFSRGFDTMVFNGSFAEVYLTGGPSANYLSADGYSGPVTIKGEGGADTLVGGAGDDTLDGGAGDDTLAGGAGKDRYLASPGGDTASGASVAEGDTLELTTDSDMLLTPETLSWAGNSTEIVNGSFAEVILTGGAGANTIDASAYFLPVTVKAGAGNDTIKGGSADDTLAGEDGDDTITGGLGNDTITGGAGDDTVDGRGEALAAPGGALAGVPADDDTMDGGAGTDTLVQVADADQTLTDTQATGSGTDGISNFETAALTGGAGANTIDASGFSGPVTIKGEGGADTLVGGAGDDTLDGGDGDDSIFGGDGDDMLLGGDGDDTLNGGAGVDTYRGGAGTTTQTDHQFFLPIVKR